MQTPEQIDQFNRKKYEHAYTVAHVSIDRHLNKNDYFSKMAEIKLNFVKKYGLNKNVLDIGCGCGDYLFEVKDMISSGIGIDYTDKAVHEAILKKERLSASNLNFIKTNARHLPFNDGCFDLVFSFSTLAHVPRQEDVVREVARTLKPNGMAVLEMGNIFSLNTAVCNAHAELVKTCHIRTSEMRRMIDDAQLTVVGWRAFQLLPFWGEKPRSLRVLLHPVWKRFFQKEINGKMLDEWFSNLPLLRQCAYRHFIICQKD